MALRCGIIGIAGVGKTTIFNCISNTKAATGTFGSGSSKTNIGMVRVPDPRLYELEKRQSTEKVTPTTVEIVDIPGLSKASGGAEGSGNRFLGDIRNTDALIHVLRCFDDEMLPHAEGSVDPVRDIETINLELQVRDHDSLGKKIEKLRKTAKSGDKDAVRGIEVLELYSSHLGGFNDARSLDAGDDAWKYIADLSLLTMKPVMYVCNVDEKSAIAGNSYTDSVKKYLQGQDTRVLTIAGAIEAEISELDNAADRNVYLKDIGMTEPGVDRLVRAAYSLLDLRTFFTVGPKEIRAWTIRRGMNASRAAGVIHSDLERGFIRAEVMKYDDFVTLGSESACREAGKLLVAGRNYIVEDGDIIHVRFNV
ncbi:MAG: redox-regulated ATPase YchF [Bacteroidales bacterium]|jgi:GTP-binding protein YchF|nr:redox-regulated ATPase YchF [Bacteroidales bacterium]